ncbi:MAG TPA: hypothetical protein VGI40_07050 [Pirellulaceae bacterium]|jgi:hypothetical protein
MRLATFVVLSLPLVEYASAQDARPLTPAEALTKVDQKVTVAIDVKSTGGKTARFLNSESDFRAEKNFAVFIPNIALAAFKKASIEDPGEYYKGKSIIATGNVEMSQGRPQLRVESPVQIKVVEARGDPASVNRPATPK